MRRLLKNCSVFASENGKWIYLPDGYLGIDGAVIDYVGADRPRKPYDTEKDLSGRLLLPGLVNAHGHAAMTLLRGVGSGLPLQKWLFEKVMPIEARMTAEDVRTGNELALLEMIASGTTSYTDMYFFPESAAEAALKAGIKANLCRPVQCFDENERYEDNLSARESVELFRRYHMAGDGRIRIDFSIHGEYTIRPQIAKPYSDVCRELGGRMHIHLSETKKEQEECVARHGKTPARWFYDLGTFDSPTSAAHCVWVDGEDLALMREKGVAVLHNPTSNMKLGSGFAPLPRFLETGLTVALGTDGAASNNNLNMFEEMHVSSLIHCGYLRDSACLNPEQILTMATRSGALTQGRPDTGSLEAGKRADLIAVDLDRPHLVPNLDPAALLTDSAQGSDVVMTMVDGRILYENGEFFTLDRERILSEAKAAVRRLLPQSG